MQDRGWHSIGLEMRSRFPDGDNVHDIVSSLDFCPICSRKMGYLDDPLNDKVVARIEEALRSALRPPAAVNA